MTQRATALCASARLASMTRWCGTPGRRRRGRLTIWMGRSTTSGFASSPPTQLCRCPRHLCCLLFSVVPSLLCGKHTWAGAQKEEVTATSRESIDVKHWYSESSYGEPGVNCGSISAETSYNFLSCLGQQNVRCPV